MTEIQHATHKIVCVDLTLAEALRHSEQPEAETARTLLFDETYTSVDQELHVLADLLQSRDDLCGQWLANWLALRETWQIEHAAWVPDAADLFGTWRMLQQPATYTHYGIVLAAVAVQYTSRLADERLHSLSPRTCWLFDGSIYIPAGYPNYRITYEHSHVRVELTLMPVPKRQLWYEQSAAHE